MNTKSKLKAISIGIAAIIMMVSLFATVSVSASPGVVVTDCWIGDDNKVYFTIYSEANEETGYARLYVDGAYEERKMFSLKPQDTATLSFRTYRWSEYNDVEVCVDASCCELPCEPKPTPMPDLVVSDKWKEFANGEVIVHYRVTNIGDAMAGSSDAGVDVNGYRMDTEEVPELGPGASYDSTFTLDCTPGATLDVTVCADVYGVVDESNESNNCMIYTVTCPPGPLPGGPDLVVEKEEETFAVGTDCFFNVSVTVTNIGNEIAGASRTCLYIDGLELDHGDAQRLGPGASDELFFGPLNCSCGDPINVTVCADTRNVVRESNETNNCVANILVVQGTHVVIQAFDQNPAGYPTTEWVMLYNPANESVNISGWSISSIKYRGGRSFTIIKNISIAARNYLTFVPGKQWLHDEDETIILKDAAGNIVDKIVNASDGDADNRYWERFDSDWQFGLQTLDTGGMRRGTVKYVYDGDTIHISPVCAKATEFITYNSTDDGKIYISPVAMAGIQSVRLDGIDAPELGTEEGNISMNFLDDLCSGKEVVFDIDDGRQYDKYNRVLAMVFCANGTNVNQEMLINGSAIPLIILPSEFVPYANYTYRPLNPVVNQRITFNASSSWTFDPEAAIISYEWSFGDGTNGTGEITNHSFHSPGNYTVRLEVTDSDGEERRCNAREMTIRICSKNP